MKKLLLLSVLLLVLLALAACAGGGEPGETTAPATTTAAGGSTTAPVTTTAPLTGSELLSALSPYITLAREDYYGLTVKVPLPSKVTDGDVESYLGELLLSYAEYRELSEGTVASGDKVEIYYRGEVNTAEGWVEFVGGSNLHNITPHPLVIGSGTFIPGFEEGLIGLSVGETALTTSTAPTLVTDLTENSVVYVNYKYKYSVGDAEKTGSFSDRIDLAATAGRYAGSALPTALLEKSVGTELAGPYTATFDIDGDLVPEELTITEVRLTKIVTEEEPFCISLRFPENYHAALAGKEARFYVVVEAVHRPEPPELTYELLTEEIGLTAEALTPFIPEGATGTREEKLLLAFRPYLKDLMERSLEEEIYGEAMNAFWEIMAAHPATAYPETLVTELVAELRAMAENAYLEHLYSGGANTYTEFVYAYFGEPMPEGGADVDGLLLTVAQREVKCRLILYYIAAAEGWELTPTERTEGCEAYLQELLDDYNAYYGGSLTKEDLVNAGYTEEVVREEVLREKVHDALFASMKGRIEYEEKE